MYNTIELFLYTLNLKLIIVKLVYSVQWVCQLLHVLLTTALRYIVRMVSSNVTTVYRYFTVIDGFHLTFQTGCSQERRNKEMSKSNENE